ncbi:MAG TPA: LytTR family DNA-binding domain-containing protein [Prolixibacteraceae bacterium]|nr:LytTR family DNA-binding domain-containing protein [Prolixibacteraceae bacterium]
MLKTLIVDDEWPVRQMLTTLAGTYCDGISVVGTADSVATALQEISRETPDLILLDVGLPDGSGFDLLEQLGEKAPMVVFITAYDEFAIRAFRFSAVDYLMKPVNTEELQKAVAKCRERKEREDLNAQLKVLVQNFNDPTGENKKIILKTAECIHIVKVSEIIRCEADHNYTEFYLVDSKKILVSKSLREYDELLSGYGFFRSHQSHLININHIRRFEKADGGELVMADESRVPVAKRKREELLQLFNQL